MPGSLSQYWKKRDFKATPEPEVVEAPAEEPVQWMVERSPDQCPPTRKSRPPVILYLLLK